MATEKELAEASKEVREASPVGLRASTGKLRASLFDQTVFWQTVACLQFNSEAKYCDDNWKKGLSFADTINCLERHIADFKNGKRLDPETGLHVLTGAMCNVMFLMYWDLYINEYRQYDDRGNRFRHAPDIRKLNDMINSKITEFKAALEVKKNAGQA